MYWHCQVAISYRPTCKLYLLHLFYNTQSKTSNLALKKLSDVFQLNDRSRNESFCQISKLKNTNESGMKLSWLALQHHGLFHLPQQLVMKKTGLNTANIETKEAKCLWSWKKACRAISVRERVSHYLSIHTSAVCCFPYIVCTALNSPGFWQKVKAPRGSLIPQTPAKINEPINPSLNVFFHSYLIFLLLKFDVYIYLYFF